MQRSGGLKRCRYMWRVVRSHRLSAAGMIFVLASVGCGSAPEPSGTARSAADHPAVVPILPEGIAIDAEGRVFVSDCPDHRIYRLEAGGPVVVGGIGHGEMNNGFSGDGGPAVDARFSCPAGLAFDGTGRLFVADHANNRVRVIDRSGIVTTVAGSGPAGVDRGRYAGDGGVATHARLSEPIGVAVDADGNLFIADRDDHVVREVDARGVITTIAGTGETGFSGDGGPATRAELEDPEYICVDAEGNVYFTDQINERVRMIDRRGVITTVAGTGQAGYSGDGGPAVDASLNEPYGLAVDPKGNVYVADSSGDRVRMIDPQGVIITVAGTGEAGYSGDGGPATAAMLNGPAGLAIDAAGDLYISDSGNGVVRVVHPDGTIDTVGRPV